MAITSSACCCCAWGQKAWPEALNRGIPPSIPSTGKSISTSGDTTWEGRGGEGRGGEGRGGEGRGGEGRGGEGRGGEGRGGEGRGGEGRGGEGTIAGKQGRGGDEIASSLPSDAVHKDHAAVDS